MGVSKGKALVIGCGVAGPAVAVALRRAGFDVALHEAWEDPDDTAGGWLVVMPNGVSVLRTLGVADTMAEAALPCERIEFRDHGHRRFAQIPLPGAVAARRGALHRVLRDRAAELGADVSFGRRLMGVQQSGDTVVAEFEDGTRDTGQLLVGCDGLRSRVREVTFPDAAGPRYAGLVSSVGLCRTPSGLPPGPALVNIFGRRTSFRYVVNGPGEVFWSCDALVRDEADPEPTDGEAWRLRLLTDLMVDDSPAASLVVATETIARHPTYRLPPLSDWYRGRVCLAGDAAHAMPPYAGQGASMALEDAVTLAMCLRDRPDVPAAFAAYQSIRRPRQARVAAVTANNGRTLAARNPVSRWLRNRMIPIGLRVSADSALWINSHEIDWDRPVQVPA